MDELKLCPFCYGENGDDCSKWSSPYTKCKPSTLEWCDTQFQHCDMNQMCCESSVYGNYYFYVTDEDIEALKNGKVLFYVDEYGMFIGYKKEDEQNG